MPFRQGNSMSIRPGADSEIITLCRKMLAICQEEDALVHEGNDLGYSDPKDHKPKRHIVWGAKFHQFAVAIANCDDDARHHGNRMDLQCLSTLGKTDRAFHRLSQAYNVCVIICGHSLRPPYFPRRIKSRCIQQQVALPAASGQRWSSGCEGLAG